MASSGRRRHDPAGAFDIRALGSWAAILFLLVVAPSWGADAGSDRQALAYLSDTATAKEVTATASYKARDGAVAVRELEELRQIYKAIAVLRNLHKDDLRNWRYMLLIANGRLANAYGWIGDTRKAMASTREAMRYSHGTLSKPLSSRSAVQQFIAGIDQKL